MKTPLRFATARSFDPVTGIPLLLILSIVLFAASHYSRAQKNSSNSDGDVAMQRLVSVGGRLRTLGDTNLYSDFIALLRAKDTLTSAKDAAMSVALLQRLRDGRTNEVIAALEISLDGALRDIEETTDPELRDVHKETMRLVREYRSKYPRNGLHTPTNASTVPMK